MKKEIPFQLIVGVAILLIGGGILGGEYYLVKWLPKYRESVRADALKPVPYKNDKLGIEIQISSGFTGRTEEFTGGVRITRPKFMSIGPTITITAQPNPDGMFEFDPKALAKWQTDDVYQQLSRYRFLRIKINNRDAVFISQYKNGAMVFTTRVISSERIIEINCSPGREDDGLYQRACDETARSLKVAGPEPPAPLPPVIELASPPPRIR